MSLKVLHLTYDMRIGGTEMVIKNIIEGADRKQFNMSIFCIEAPLGPWGKELREDGIAVDSYERQPGFDRSLIKAIRQHLKLHQIDVLHCHQYTPWVYGVLAALGLKTRVVFTEHGRFYPDSSSWKRRLVNPWLCRITDKITAISNATKQALGDFENIPTHRIETVYNGIKPLTADSQQVELLRQQLKIDKTIKIIGTVARLDSIKNHKMMLKAFAQVIKKQPNTLLLLVGDGDERANLEQLIAQLGLQQHVMLTGYQTDPRHHIALMDIFLLPSFSEGTSMTLLEALSLGKPCLVTNVGGNPEVIKHQVNGLVSENDNERQFATNIEQLLANNDLYKKLSSEAKTIFEQKFHFNLMNEIYRSIYSTMVHYK